jgi:hypothetical protein
MQQFYEAISLVESLAGSEQQEVCIYVEAMLAGLIF